MNISKPVTEVNIPGHDIVGSSNEVNFSSNPSTTTYGPSKSALPVQSQVDNIGHVIGQDENKTRRRFRQCKINIKYICVKCQVRLHANCFEQFHTK